jgi:putative ABC transport system substrate-binding protein
MNRREFITLLGGATAAWPARVSAQLAERIRRVGVLITLEANDPEGESEVKALKQGFQELGWVENRNLQLEIRWSGGDPSRIQAAAKELITLPCEVIVARSTPAVAALIKETRTIPIVFSYVVDPVGSGFVQSFARPGGNVTGFHDTRQVAATAHRGRAFCAAGRIAAQSGYGSPRIFACAGGAASLKFGATGPVAHS